VNSILVPLHDQRKWVDRSAMERPQSATSFGRAVLWAALVALVILHFALVVGLVGSFFVLPFTERWCVSVPLCVFVYFYSTSAVKCLLTDLENYLRQRLGLARIRGFVGHYFIKPFRKQRAKF
jgi:hypothetical protein